MSNQVLFVTGATQNTGLAIAEKFAESGFDIALSSRDIGRAQETAKKISDKWGVKSVGYALDLANVDDIRRVFAEIKSDFGRLDTFVANSANLGIGGSILDVTPQEFDDVINVNLRGNYFCFQESARLMKDSGGSIVIVGSVHYKQGMNGRSTYAASKGALAALTRSMAFELGRYKIRANYIVSGAIHTNRWDGISSEECNSRRDRYPAGRESYPEDIANAAFYLGTDLSKTVTGTDLTVDSGVGICMLPFNGGRNQ